MEVLISGIRFKIPQVKKKQRGGIWGQIKQD